MVARGQAAPRGRPGDIKRDAATGVATYELWWREDKQHREDGPAVIKRDAATGVATYEEWWLNGVQQKPPQRKAIPAPAAPQP